MDIKLLHNTPLHIASSAIRKCYKSERNSDTVPYEVDWANGSTADFHLEGKILSTGVKDKALIERIGNQMKHKSTLRHVQYIFECNDVSTKTLLAFTRHSVGKDISVESTRFTLSKRADELSFTRTHDSYVNDWLEEIMEMVAGGVSKGCSNDNLAMILPQAYNYSFITTMNIQSLQHLLSMRTPKTAHWDIREFAYAIAEQIPEEHKYLFQEYIYGAPEYIKANEGIR